MRRCFDCCCCCFRRHPRCCCCCLLLLEMADGSWEEPGVADFLESLRSYSELHKFWDSQKWRALQEKGAASEMRSLTFPQLPEQKLKHRRAIKHIERGSYTQRAPSSSEHQPVSYTMQSGLLWVVFSFLCSRFVLRNTTENVKTRKVRRKSKREIS